MAEVRVCYRENGTIGVRFAYNPDLVAMIKDEVAGIDREYDPNTKTWTIADVEVLDPFLAALAAAGHRVRASGVRREKSRQPPPRQPRAASAATWADTLLATVGPTRRKAVFKALTSVLHPDRPDTGDRDLFEQLETARRKADR